MIHSEVAKSSPVISLALSIHKETSEVYWLGRIWKALQSVYQREGTIYAAASGALLVTSTTYATTSACLLIEGSFRALDEAHHSLQKGHLVRDFGDAGGWLALSWFTYFALGKVITSCISMEEYRRIEPLILNWYKKQMSGDSEIKLENLYPIFYDLLHTFSSRSLLSPTVIDNRIQALKIVRQIERCHQSKLAPSGSENPSTEQVEDTTLEWLDAVETPVENDETLDDSVLTSDLEIDMHLRAIYLEIQQAIELGVSASNYFGRVSSGFASIGKTKGLSGQLQAIALGFVSPAFLASLSVCSLIGIGPLGIETYKRIEDLVSRGHLGEWAINAIESGAATYGIHKYVILNEGDFTVVREIFSQKLAMLRDKMEKYSTPSRKLLYNRLCAVANEELRVRAGRCYFSKLPIDYLFENNH